MLKRKRSRHVALVLAGTATLALAACEDDRVDAQSFPDLQSCIAAAEENSLFFTAEDCRTNFAAAQEEYLETAPRYESKELCEQQHGAGNCGDDPVAQNSGGGGFSFMPLLMGYMLGSMMSRGGGVFSQPMVRTADGRFATPKGDQSFASNRGAGKVPTQTFTRAPSTLGKPPLSSAAVAQRGGFGQSSTARSSSRGFGG
ncbi:DUF1190 domain-containing protein [Paracoccus sulfuroxidans]|uniref:Uncharacterized protein YgiB involved in biofilm formation n=1 Tax=Paracoccus sulfuroxidans TaxID=384678 RepID=A0A562P0N1_9RHOB|nr:DUF1190 domain-containing protein [Paracoccus sulfuroxidans]TWI38052.1 uncharacterized protein YgiB involved in biofilm formation [Paracoccus sulfuroxidans]